MPVHHELGNNQKALESLKKGKGRHSSNRLNKVYLGLVMAQTGLRRWVIGLPLLLAGATRVNTGTQAGTYKKELLIPGICYRETVLIGIK